MSEATPTRATWFQPSDPLAPRERVLRLVAALTRARRLQLLVDHALVGLLAGLAVATVAALAVRLIPLPFPLWQVTTVATGIALLLAVAVGWRRRPDALEVAIHADVKLRLKQRLSTAWEIMTRRDDAALAERLAMQAVRAELPARPWQVFPLRINRWGILLPLPAVALLLVGVLDLNGTQATVPRQVDQRVMSEGQRLSAFARAMQARARQDALPRSARQAAALERLGARMESGALSRGQAVEQLRQMDRSLDRDSVQALADTRADAIESPIGQRGRGLPDAGGMTAGATSERGMEGAVHGEDTRAAMQDRLEELVRSGVSRLEMEHAIRRKEVAKGEAVRDEPQSPQVSAQALRDYEELQRARERVRRARENLDDPQAGVAAAGGSAIDMEANEGDDTPEDRAADQRRSGRKTGKPAGHKSRGDDSTRADEAPESPPERHSAASGAVMRAQGEMGPGEVFASEGRVVPNVTRPGVENIQMNRAFSSQVESVLSRDYYPEHYKEFVRRYFLSLSQGERGHPSPPTAKRDGRGE